MFSHWGWIARAARIGKYVPKDCRRYSEEVEIPKGHFVLSHSPICAALVRVFKATLRTFYLQTTFCTMESSHVWFRRFCLNFPQLREFIPRVRINRRISSSPRRIRRKVVSFFQKMISGMTREEVRKHFRECLRCWTNILKHFFKGLKVGVLVKVLYEALAVFYYKLPDSMKWHLLSASATALDRHSDVMLQVLDDVTSDGWSVSTSTLLMAGVGKAMPMAEILHDGNRMGELEVDGRI